MGTGFVALDRIHIGTTKPVFEELGGSCGNVLISLAMLGRSVMPLLRLGADGIGTRLERDLRLAGADTRLVARRHSVRSPVIVELLDPASSHHRFSSSCPQSSKRFGSFQPITRYELAPARKAIEACNVFFADRLSDAICTAMETAFAGGAIIYFEPSSLAEPALLKRALAVTHIFKYSADRLSSEISASVSPATFLIVTAGSEGLELYYDGETHHCSAIAADVVKDTCGAGDMVTLGLIDTILQSGAASTSALSFEVVLAGVRAGQRLAAANCAYIGARGLFRERGAAHAREILAET